MLRDQLAPVLEDEDDKDFMEQKGEELEGDNDSDYGSDCSDSDV